MTPLLVTKDPSKFHEQAAPTLSMPPVKVEPSTTMALFRLKADERLAGLFALGL